MVRLSLLEFMKESLIMAPSRWTGGGRAIRPEPECEEVEDLARMEGRFLGAVGAWSSVNCNPVEIWICRVYHDCKFRVVCQWIDLAVCGL